jgi:hypothetical protein
MAVLHVCPGRVQMPQLGLQQTSPALQVDMPQGMLAGIVGASHTRSEQVAPGSAQMPQLALQQTSPTLHVFGPQSTLVGATGTLHRASEHCVPSATQRPQQHVLPGEHRVGPQATGGGGAAATEADATAVEEAGTGAATDAAAEADAGGPARRDSSDESPIRSVPTPGLARGEDSHGGRYPAMVPGDALSVVRVVSPGGAGGEPIGPLAAAPTSPQRGSFDAGAAAAARSPGPIPPPGAGVVVEIAVGPSVSAGRERSDSVSSTRPVDPETCVCASRLSRNMP